jgi:hypothetical protein
VYLPELLAQLALNGTHEGTLSFSRRDVEAAAEGILERHGFRGRELDREIAHVLHSAEDRMGVLVSNAPLRFAFVHPMFQHFHTARALLRMGADARHELARTWNALDWSNVWPLFVLGGAERDGHVDMVLQTVLDAASADEADSARCACLRWAGCGRFPLPAGSPAWQTVAGWLQESLSLRDQAFHTALDAVACWEKALPAFACLALQEALQDTDEDIRHAAAHVVDPGQAAG